MPPCASTLKALAAPRRASLDSASPMDLRPSLRPARAASLLLVASACATTTGTKVAVTTPPPTTDPCHRAGPVKVVMRGAELLKSPNGPVAADVWNPLVVELLPDGRVKAHDSVGNPVEGYAPDPKAGPGGEERGLGLFVQVEAPLSLDPRGPPIGRVLPGTYLPVLSVDACAAEVIVRGFARKLVSGSHGVLKAYVPVEALAPKDLTAKPSTRVLGAMRDHHRRLLVEPGQPSTAFTETRCGRLSLLETRRGPNGETWQKVAQEEKGIEIQGWVDQPILEARGEDRCPLRELGNIQVMSFDGDSSGLPDGFARPAEPDALAKEWEKLTKKERPVWIPVVDGEEIACREYKLKAKGVGLAREEEKDGRKATYSFGLRLSGEHLSVSGGPCRGKPSCSLKFLLVGLDAHRVALLPTSARVPAYHVDDTEPWFFDRRGCESHGGVDHASTSLP